MDIDIPAEIRVPSDKSACPAIPIFTAVRRSDVDEVSISYREIVDAHASLSAGTEICDAYFVVVPGSNSIRNSPRI